MSPGVFSRGSYTIVFLNQQLKSARQDGGLRPASYSSLQDGQRVFGEIEGLLDSVLTFSAQLDELAANAALGHVNDLGIDFDQVIFGGKFYQ
jgi:hypothetical protein